jgi:iron complex outermembrane receptor protein
MHIIPAPTRRLGWLAALSLLAPLAGHAVTLPAVEESLLFQEIPAVFGASRYEQKISEAPSSITLIGAEDIRRYGYRTLTDILRSVRGFYTTYDRNYNYVGVRGFGRPTDYNSRLLVMVDGHRINDSIFDGAYIGTEFVVDVDNIDRVEIIRGPGSALYGTNAIFAVVNVITRRGRDLNGTEVSAELMSFGTTKGLVSWGKRDGGTEMLLSASSYRSQGQDLYFKGFDDPATNNGVAEDADRDRAQRLFAKLARGDFTFEAAWVTRTKGVPTAAYDSLFNDNRQQAVDERAFLSLKHQTELGDRAQLATRLAYDHYDYDGTYANGSLGPLTKDYGYWRAWLAEVQYTREFSDTHKLVLGADYQRNTRQDQGGYEVDDPLNPYLTDRRTSTRWAVFAQDEIRLSEATRLYLGARHDHYSATGGTANPRAALVTNLTPDTVLKLLHGRAFRAPNPYELYYTPSPWLTPEKIVTSEVVLEQVLRPGLRGTATLYQYRIDDLINQQPDYTFRNTGSAVSHGVEIEIDGRLFARVDGRASLAHQNTEDGDTGRVLSNSPRNLAKLNLSSPLGADTLIGGLEIQYTDRRKTLGGDYTAGFALVNFTLTSRGLAKGLELSASVYNLADKDYADPAGEEHRANPYLTGPMESIPQDGRHYRLKVKYEF